MTGDEAALLPPPSSSKVTVFGGSADANLEGDDDTSRPAAPPKPSEPLHVEAKAPRPAHEATLAPLPSSWISSKKSRRAIPKAAKWGLGAVATLLGIVILLPHACDASSKVQRTSMIADEAVEASSNLTKRRHLTADDFRVRTRSVDQLPAAPEALAVPLSERQRLRENNVEDLRSRGRRRKRTGRRRGKPRAEQPVPSIGSDDLFYIVEDSNLASDLEERQPSRRDKGELLAPAASTVRVSLAADIVIRRSSATVVALVSSGEVLPQGTKLLGKASAGRDGLVSVRFRSLVLPNGESIRIQGEARDASGSSAFVGMVSGGKAERGVAKSVGTEAAERATLGLLGGGFVGQTARDVFSETDRADRHHRTPVVVRLSRVTPMDVLLLREIRSHGGAL